MLPPLKLFRELCERGAGEPLGWLPRGLDDEALRRGAARHRVTRAALIDGCRWPFGVVGIARLTAEFQVAKEKRRKKSLFAKLLMNPLGLGDLLKAAWRTSPNDPLYGKAFEKKRRFRSR